MEKEVFDITIIGGGPVGLFTAFYAHLRDAKVKIIESLHQLGGQPGTLYAEKTIFDIPAYPQLTGEELTFNLIEQLNRFDTTICLNETVQAIDKKEDLFVLQTNSSVHYSKSIIIAMGGGAFSPRLLDLDKATEFANLHYFVKKLDYYKDQTVVICGGGDSAVDWALALEPIAEKVILVHRRDAFRALEHSVKKLEESTVEIKTPYLPTQLIGENGVLTHLEVTKVRTQESEQIPLDHLLVNYGFKSSIGELKKWNLELNRQTIVVNSKQETSVPGIYAVGDCCFYDGKVQLIATGFGEAPTAVNNAMTYLDPSAKTQPMHSSSLFV